MALPNHQKKEEKKKKKETPDPYGSGVFCLESGFLVYKNLARKL